MCELACIYNICWISLMSFFFLFGLGLVDPLCFLDSLEYDVCILSIYCHWYWHEDMNKIWHKVVEICDEVAEIWNEGWGGWVMDMRQLSYDMRWLSYDAKLWHEVAESLSRKELLESVDFEVWTQIWFQIWWSL